MDCHCLCGSTDTKGGSDRLFAGIVTSRTGVEAVNGLFTSPRDTEDRVITTRFGTSRHGMTSLSTSQRSMLFLLVVFLCLCQDVIAVSSLPPGGSKVTEYCENEIFTADCGDKAVIIITHALYGRMNRGRCLREFQYQTGCVRDVQSYLDRDCSGRTKCTVAVSSLIKYAPESCSIELRNFLEAAFVCKEALPDHNDRCLVDLGKPENKVGHFASQVPSKFGCGNHDKPWLLKSESGQKINLTIIDFLAEASQPIKSIDHFNRQSSECIVYATFKEVLHGGQWRTACNSSNKEVNVFLSSAKMLEVRFMKNTQQTSGQSSAYSFLVKYEAVGCEDPEISSGAWLRREEFHAIVGCDDHPQGSIRLTCNGTFWSHNVSNFCNAERNNFINNFLFNSSSEIFKGLSIIIIAIVAAGVGLCILLAGLTYLRRRRSQQRQPQFQQPQFYDKSARTGQYGSYKDAGYNPQQHFQHQQQQQYLLTYDTPQARRQHRQQQQHQQEQQANIVSSTSQVTGEFPQISSTCHQTVVTPPTFAENIYESPKFDRKYSDDVVLNAGGICVGETENGTTSSCQENVVLF